MNNTFNEFSYRIPGSINGSIKSIFIFLKASVLLLWKRNNKPIKLLRTPKIIFYDVLKSTEKNSKEYFNHVFKNPPEFGLFRNDLPNTLNFFEKVFFSFIIILLFFPALFHFFIKRNSNSFLFILELIENLLVFNFCISNKIEKVYILSCTERDIIFLCYLLNQKNIKTELFPSANPLKLFYKHVYSDKMWLSAPFQINEAKLLLSNWKIKEFGMVPPYDFQYIKLHTPNEVYKYKVGIISSGMGFRHKKGMKLGDEKELLAEESLQKAIKKLIKSGQIKCEDFVVFLHPKEKQPEDRMNVEEFYKEIFGFPVNFGPFDLPTNKSFYLCEVGIATISTSQIERLFGGFKSIFAPLDVLKQPFSDQKLDSISAKSIEELLQLIKTCLSLNENQYFEYFNLKNYRHNDFSMLPMNEDYCIKI